VLGRLRRPQP